MKKQQKSFLYFIFIVALLAFIIFLVISIKNSRVPLDKYLPFAYLPEINISESPNFVSDMIIQKAIGMRTNIIDQEMLHGLYQRFPLNRNMQPTSLVAINATPENPNLLAWQVQSSVDTWNYVWSAPSQYYWINMFDVHANPVVVIKGKFPKCRYFSYMPYSGVELGEDGNKYFGQGVSGEKGDRICNSTLPGDCQTLVDYQIEPDPGSKNPFRDASYQDTDDNFYTIYFISPYYKGKRPQSKNILPMTVYGLNQCLIMYRVYAPFNPKSCQSAIYSSQFPFNTTNCREVPFPIALQDPDGSSVYPQNDKTSPCNLQDKVCIKACVNHEIGKNADPDCFQYLGNNQYCVCAPENFYGPCGQYLDKTIRKCTDGKGGLSNYCAGAPKQEVDYCVRKIPIREEVIDGIPQCPSIFSDPPQKPDYVCEWVRSGIATPCIYEKLFASKNKDCLQYRDPSKFIDLCKMAKDPPPGSCASEMPLAFAECLNLRDDKGEYDPAFQGTIAFNLTCGKINQSTPPFAYQPQYDFEDPPRQCPSTCNRYTCTNGYCVPNVNGEFTTPDCDSQCIQPTSPPEPTRKPRKHLVEHFSNKERGCVNRFLPENCNREAQPYINIHNYGANTFNQRLIASTGWVGLPDVFVKYSYNNYFIRLQNPDVIRIPQNLMDLMKRLYSNWQMSPIANPLDPFQVKQQNPDINLKQYVQTLEQEQRVLTEPFTHEDKPRKTKTKKIFVPISTPRPTKQPRPRPTRRPRPTPGASCTQYVDKEIYFNAGTEYPKMTLRGGKTTIKVDPIGCAYYQDLCACENNGNKFAKPCNTTVNGYLGCDGKPCFKRWGLEDPCHRFLGEAIPFSISSDYGKTIVFPDADDAYLAAPTVYDRDRVYIIWMDCPTTPVTPGYDGIVKKNYDLRYWSFEHGYWASEPLHQRPGLSGKYDEQYTRVEVSYKDDRDHVNITGQRVCIVVASYEQYNYLQTYDLWDDRVNWLNWGTTRLPSVGGDTTPPPFVSGGVNGVLPENLGDLQNFILDKVNIGLEEWGLDPLAYTIAGQSLDSYGVSLDGNTTNRQDKQLFTPERGILIMRQLAATKQFKSSIRSYVESQPECLASSIEVPPSQIFLEPIEPSQFVSPSCNPGNPKICQKYGLDPCCLSKDVLSFTKQYYPRCERVKICDIENGGKDFWKRYFDLPLPYITDAPDTPSCRL